VPATTLNGLRRSGSIAEVWAHEASLIDANDLPYFRGGMLSEQQHRWWGPVLQEHPRIAKEVLRRIEAEGPLTPGDFGGAGTPGWWEWSPAKQVFEALFSSGQLAVRERRSFARVYDLPERLYTAQQLTPVDDAAALRWRVLRAVTARGIVTEKRLSDYFRVKKMTFKPVVIAELNQVEQAFFAGRCDVYTTDKSGLAATRLKAANKDDYVILPEAISKEPLGPMIRRGDWEFFNAVRWTLFGLIEAEEYGVTSANVDKLKSDSKDPPIMRLVGTSGDVGKGMGFDNDWLVRVIKAVGNYGEMFNRNISPLGLDRDQNALWKDDGLMYAPPIR
jgi:hypothetical protein